MITAQRQKDVVPLWLLLKSEGQILSCCTLVVTSSCSYLPEMAAKWETYPVLLTKGHIEVCMRDRKGQLNLPVRLKWPISTPRERKIKTKPQTAARPRAAISVYSVSVQGLMHAITLTPPRQTHTCELAAPDQGYGTLFNFVLQLRKGKNEIVVRMIMCVT